MSPPAVFIRICDLGIALGWDNISTLPGCQEYQIDSEWWFAINPHGEPTTCSKGGTEVPPHSIYFQFNGWPAGIFSYHGGMMAAGRLANEETLLAAIEAAIKKLECPAPAQKCP